MKFKDQVASATKKANKMLGMIKRNLEYINKQDELIPKPTNVITSAANLVPIVVSSSCVGRQRLSTFI